MNQHAIKQSHRHVTLLTSCKEEVLEERCGTRFGRTLITEPEGSGAGDLTRTGDGPADPVYQWFLTFEQARRRPGSVQHLAAVCGHGPGWITAPATQGLVLPVLPCPSSTSNRGPMLCCNLDQRRPATHIAERRPSSRRGGYTALRPVLLNQSAVEAFRRALVRDKVFANRTLLYSGEYRWTLGSVCAVSEDLWIDFVDFLCKKTAL